MKQISHHVCVYSYHCQPFLTLTAFAIGSRAWMDASTSCLWTAWEEPCQPTHIICLRVAPLPQTQVITPVSLPVFITKCFSMTHSYYMRIGWESSVLGFCAERPVLCYEIIGGWSFPDQTGKGHASLWVAPDLWLPLPRLGWKLIGNLLFRCPSMEAKRWCVKTEPTTFYCGSSKMAKY